MAQGMKARDCLLICCVLFVLTGCAVHRASEFVSRFQYADAVNTVQVHHAGDMVLTTYGKIRGEDEYRIRQVDKIASAKSGFVTVDLLVEARAESAVQRMFEEDLEAVNRFQYALASSLRETLVNLEVLEDREITVKLVADEFDSGKSFANRAHLNEEPVIISFVLPVIERPDMDPVRPDWWSQAAKGIAHELVHVKHGIHRTQVDSVNGETAAELVGICATMYFVQALDVDAVFGFTDFLELDFVKSAFPDLRDGEFSPRLEHFDFMSGPGPKGRTIANAIAYLHSDDEKIYMNRPGSTDRLLGYCKQISLEVPDFQSGRLW